MIGDQDEDEAFLEELQRPRGNQAGIVWRPGADLGDHRAMSAALTAVGFSAEEIDGLRRAVIADHRATELMDCASVRAWLALMLPRIRELGPRSRTTPEALCAHISGVVQAFLGGRSIVARRTRMVARRRAEKSFTNGSRDKP